MRTSVAGNRDEPRQRRQQRRDSAVMDHLTSEPLKRPDQPSRVFDVEEGKELEKALRKTTDGKSGGLPEF
jgi:hypothetical protein